MVWEIVFAHGPEENRAKPIPKCCFCIRSLGKQTESMRNLHFLQRSLGKQMKPIEKSWFGKSFFAHGPEENRAKPIPKCSFYTRSLGKQTESKRNLIFLQRSLGKQMKPIEESWSGKSFLPMVLRKTEQNLFRNVVFAHGP